VSIESLNISPVIIANNAHVQSLLDAQKNHGTEFGTIDEIKRSTQ
jgi:S-adenosylhomocysteine hydrolase